MDFFCFTPRFLPNRGFFAQVATSSEDFSWSVLWFIYCVSCHHVLCAFLMLYIFVNYFHSPLDIFHSAFYYIFIKYNYNLLYCMKKEHPITSESYGFRALFTHEVGHALGLAHFAFDTTPVIMDEPAFQVYARDGIYTPQWPDIDGVEAIY